MLKECNVGIIKKEKYCKIDEIVWMLTGCLAISELKPGHTECNLLICF
jgi:hypothetical protein